MFEGKHIHFSPVDNKPLCSCSTKVCRQRRLNGYAFCIRHILEDSSAPFRLCSFVPQPGQNKCTNVISFTHPQGLCNTHLQAAGFPAAKRERRHNRPSSVSTKEKLPVKNETVETDVCGGGFDILTNGVDLPNEVTTIKPRISQAVPVQSPLTPSSMSSSGVESCGDARSWSETIVLNGKNVKAKTADPARSKPALPPQKRKLFKSAQKKPTAEKTKPVPTPVPELPLPLILRAVKEALDKESKDSTSETMVKPYTSCQRVWVQNFSGTNIADRLARRKVLIEQRKAELRRRYLQYAESSKAVTSSSLTEKVIEAARRLPNETALLLQGKPLAPAANSGSQLKVPVLTRRKCCFRRTTGEDSGSCGEMAMPCANFCSRHILYSVDQQLFQFCSARAVGLNASCSAPVLAISSGPPLCAEHLAAAGPVPVETPQNLSRSSRKKSRSTSRRLRNRRRAAIARQMSSSTVHCIEPADNGMELDVETVDSPEICSPGHPTPAQLIPGATAEEVAMLEDHDLTEVLNRLPDEAFQEIFAAAESTTRAMFEPGRDETEELERALAVDVHSLEKFSAGVNEDLADLSLIDEHTLALAHDLVMGAGISPEAPHHTIFMGPSPHVLDNLSLSAHHIDCNMEVVSNKRRLVVNQSPARGSSPPALTATSTGHGGLVYETEGASPL